MTNPYSCVTSKPMRNGVESFDTTFTEIPCGNSACGIQMFVLAASVSPPANVKPTFVVSIVVSHAPLPTPRHAETHTQTHTPHTHRHTRQQHAHPPTDTHGHTHTHHAPTQQLGMGQSISRSSWRETVSMSSNQDVGNVRKAQEFCNGTIPTAPRAGLFTFVIVPTTASGLHGQPGPQSKVGSRHGGKKDGFRGLGSGVLLFRIELLENCLLLQKYSEIH